MYILIRIIIATNSNYIVERNTLAFWLAKVFLIIFEVIVSSSTLIYIRIRIRQLMIHIQYCILMASLIVFPADYLNTFDVHNYLTNVLLNIHFFLELLKHFRLSNGYGIKNFESQNCKDDQDNNNRHLPMIEYPHFTGLELLDIHDDYAEQFLLHTRTCFSNSGSFVYPLSTQSKESLIILQETQHESMNCGKVKSVLYASGRSNLPEHFKLYFPHVK